jgi:hypothetical protein
LVYCQKCALCGLRKLPLHGLLPHVGVDVPRDGLFLFGGERWGRELGENFVEDENLDIGLRLLLFPEAIELGQPSLDRR